MGSFQRKSKNVYESRTNVFANASQTQLHLPNMHVDVSTIVSFTSSTCHTFHVLTLRGCYVSCCRLFRFLLIVIGHGTPLGTCSLVGNLKNGGFTCLCCYLNNLS